MAQSVRPVTEKEGLGAIEAKLMPQRTAITEWMSPADGRRGLRLSKVHDLARQGVRVPYSSLHRFALNETPIIAARGHERSAFRVSTARWAGRSRRA